MSWREKALELHHQGISWRQIAKQLNKPKSSVSDALRKIVKGYVKPSEIKGKNKQERMLLKTDEAHLSKPKILVLDVETSSIVLQAFSIWNVNASLDQIKEDWTLLSYSAGWYGSDEVFYDDVRYNKDIKDDSTLLPKLWELLDDADFVVCHNASFDTKSINTRFILNGMGKPSPYRIIDTLKIAKSNFRFTSNKLAYLTDKLCKDNKKLSHEKYAGFLLWKECLLGNMDAWEEMEKYNRMDVVSLKELLTILAPWDSRLPNLDIYNIDGFDKDEWVEVGYHTTNLGKYKKYQNKGTGVYKRGRENLLTKEQRSALLSNIV